MAATTSIARPADVAAARHDAVGQRSPGVPPLLGVTLVAAVLAGIALAGGVRDADRPADAGMALAIGRVTSPAAGTTEVALAVDNGTRAAFAGRVTATANGTVDQTPVTVPAGRSATVRVAVRVPCGTPIQVDLEDQSGVVRQVTAIGACGATSNGSGG